jgi:hypothetical protein
MGKQILFDPVASSGPIFLLLQFLWRMIGVVLATSAQFWLQL